MLTVSYMNKLMKDAQTDDPNNKDWQKLISEYLLVFLILVIIDIILLWKAYQAIDRCRNSGVISNNVFWVLFVIIFSPLLSILVPILSILAPLSFITTIGVIIYGNMKCGGTSPKSPMTFAMWKKMKYGMSPILAMDKPKLAMHKSDDWY